MPANPTPDPSASRLLQPGRNCWRIEKARRFSLLIDGEQFFRAVRSAIAAARHSIYILAWDIDSRMQLVPGGAHDGYPEPLGDFLHAVLAAHPHLHAYVLNWDFAMLYALEREWRPAYKPAWRTHPRLAFHMDGRHPIGASHHQKVIVIDNALAFVGGLDLTGSRWDTPEHACDNPLRSDVNGKSYAPFHDVQAMVDGEAARALGQLCRLRWERATGHHPFVHAEVGHDLWPQDVVPDLTDIEVAIARTEPPFEQRAGIFEVRQLHVDAIASARHYLFFENQYFTADLIGKVLSARLRQEHGPEVLVVSPHTQSGWLEDATMGVLRARLHRKLKLADRYSRYRLCAPFLPQLKEGCLNVHSKVLTADDNLLSVGSANLSNRSMACDTECNLAIEAVGDTQQRARIRGGIARLRARLLAEHLACTPQAVVEQTVRRASLLAAVDALTGPERSLRILDPVVQPELDALIPQPAPFDPEKPIHPDELAAQLVPEEARRPVPRRLIGLGALAIGLGVLAVSWRWTPLRDWINLASVIALARSLEGLPLTPLAVMAAYALGGLLVPITLLIAATGIVFGPLWGAAYALSGALLSASVGYALGEWLGRDAVHRLVGARINRLSRRIAKRGILAMLVVRVLPVAPFTVVNMVAGASHLRFRDFFLGTVFGMTPGILITVTFVHNLVEAVRRPSAGAITVLAAVALLLIAIALGLQRLLSHKTGMEVR